MQLDLLRHAQVVVRELGDAIARARPGFDLEAQRAGAVLGAPLDLSRLEVAGQRGEAKRRRRRGDHAHGPVPGTGHANRVLVAERERAVAALDFVKAREAARHHGVEVIADALHQLRRTELGCLDVHAIPASQERALARLRRLHVLERHAAGQRRLGVLRNAPSTSRRCSGVIRHRYAHQVSRIPTGQRTAVPRRRGWLLAPATRRCFPFSHAVQPAGSRVGPAPWSLPCCAAPDFRPGCFTDCHWHRSGCA